MILTIRCDKCGADCSEYGNRVAVDFPYGKQYDLCIKCARKLFPKKKESTDKMKRINGENENETTKA